jgi:hypothetical protein
VDSKAVRVEVGQVWARNGDQWKVTRVAHGVADVTELGCGAKAYFSLAMGFIDRSRHPDVKLVAMSTDVTPNPPPTEGEPERHPITYSVAAHHQASEAMHRASKLADVCAMLDDEVALLRGRLERAAVYFGPTAWKKFMAREETKR